MKREFDIPDTTQDKILAELHRTMRHLLHVEGCSCAEILAVIHAESVVQLAAFYGGAAAAECAEAAGRRVAHLPSQMDFAAPPAVTEERVQ